MTSGGEKHRRCWQRAFSPMAILITITMMIVYLLDPKKRTHTKKIVIPHNCSNNDINANHQVTSPNLYIHIFFGTCYNMFLTSIPSIPFGSGCSRSGHWAPLRWAARQRVHSRSGGGSRGPGPSAPRCDDGLGEKRKNWRVLTSFGTWKWKWWKLKFGVIFVAIPSKWMSV